MSKYALSVHSHTDASNLIGFYDSTTKVEDLVKRAYKIGHEGVAVTDHAIIMNHVNLFKEVEKLREWGEEQLLSDPDNADFQRAANFKSVLGSEIYLSQEGQSQATHEVGDRFFHMVVLAKDRKGWELLNEIVSTAWERSYFRAVRRIPTYMSDLRNIIGDEKGHLIATSACIGGYLRDPIFNAMSDDAETREQAEMTIRGFTGAMQDILGRDNFYFELQPAMYEEQVIYNRELTKWAKILNVPLIVANDNHYLSEEDRDVHAVFLQSQDIGDREPENFYKYTYLMTDQEIRDFLTEQELSEEVIEEAIGNTEKVLSEIERYDMRHKPIIPYIPYTDVDKWEAVIHKYDDFEWWKKMSHSNNNDKFLVYRTLLGLDNLVEKGWFPKEDVPQAVEIMNTEFMHIMQISERLQQDISTYFTTMESMLDKVWNVSVVAPSRGSAGAFFINYALGITQVNPLEFNFPSERFLHRDKASLPDVDIDTGASVKQQVIDTIKEWAHKFGGEVTNIAAYSMVKSKSALQIAARGLGYPSEDALYWGSLITNSRGFDFTLSQMFYGDPEKDIEPDPLFVAEMTEFNDVFKVALSIEGLIKNVSAHAAGIFIFNDEIYKHTATMKTSGNITITQVDLDIGEADLGLTKYDMLSTNAMDSIQITMMMLVEHGYIDWQGSLRKTYEKYLRPEVIDYEDPKMWKMIQNKEVLDLFQFLSAQVGIQAIELIQPDNLTELATINSVDTLPPSVVTLIEKLC